MENKEDAINKQIDEQLEKLSKKITDKIELEKQKLKNKIKEKKLLHIKIGKLREIPNIKVRLDLQPNTNYIINPILFCFANLEIFTEFILSEEKNEILDQYPDKKNFIRNFNDLMTNIRDKEKNASSCDNVHSYLKTEMKNKYLSQEPNYLINHFLSTLEKEINLAKVNKENEYSNLISDNFSITLKKKKICKICYHEEEISREKKYIIDLFLKKSDIEDGVELQDIFKQLLLTQEDENNLAEICSRCESDVNINKSLENLKKYLIININKIKELDNVINLKYSSPLILKGDDDKIYKFELISALCNVNTENIEPNELLNIITKNRIDFKLFFKNFINDKLFSIIGSNAEIFKGDIQNDLSNYNPNILIYRRI